MFQILTGRSSEHIVFSEVFQQNLNIDVEEPLIELKQMASKDGIDIQVISGFRNFEEQLLGWNKKARGEKPLLDDDSRPRDFNTMTEEEVLYAILKWSAIPGASRHHWGTDLDIYDGNTLPADYEIELIPQEYLNNGIFKDLTKWINEKIKTKKSLGFFRPYSKDQGGVSPEPWHFSYAPLSYEYKKKYTYDLFLKNISDSSILLREQLITKSKIIFERYVTNITPLEDQFF